MEIKTTKAEEIRILRHKVLRKGKPFSTTSYDKDENKKTLHLKAVKKGKIICCATFYPENLKEVGSKNIYLVYRLPGTAFHHGEATT